MIEQLLFTI